MNITETTQGLLKAKQDKNLTFEAIGKAIGRSEVWVAALIYGQASASSEECQKLLEILGIPESARDSYIQVLHKCPSKGGLITHFPPTDPLLNRFYEIMLVYGVPMKEIIHEKFGDGIMSAVDFTLKVEKDESKADEKRVNILMSGKFLPYKKW
ncbi:unnamed protein product [Didymodactylos carnosus]|uniref:Cyanate hydratase n=1 Tax=Didymodactylos carnosus TaxID=1234261 RepID=A0A814TBP9_9BILA|nr:unnamed protein product [Didymodactylos carnosus]CAF1159880.1 unnamed protein product [Didymodactylos carnosus]CAF3761512.1 unnamed protein product [Didymodactylos carnosus]CAF3923372.1 unnamed protein product [Didymodactylos carnosus]